ncbi:MAG: hypothetical protein V4722_22305 [Bacteroidota bacterium]
MLPGATAGGRTCMNRASLQIGQEKRGGFPSVHPDLAWLVKNRKVKALGIDTASVDYGQSKDFKTHQLLYAENILGFENVAALDQLPLKGAYIIALPMKIKAGTGGPLRIIAWVPGKIEP